MRRLVALALGLSLAVASAAPAQLGQPAVIVAPFDQQSSGTVQGTVLVSVSASPAANEGSGWFMIFPGKVVPPDGPVTPTVCFWVDSGPGTYSSSMGSFPGSFATGMVWAFSTGANCQTKATATLNHVSIAYR